MPSTPGCEAGYTETNRIPSQVNLRSPMKKPLLIVLLCVLVPGLALAQSYPADQGSWLLGGNASLTSRGDDTDDERTTSAFLSPRGQYFVVPGLALGGMVSLSYSSRSNSTRTGLGAGPAVAYYFGDGTRAFYPFVSAGFSVSRSKISIDIELPSGIDPDDLPAEFFDTERTTTSTSWEVSGGLVLMIAKNVGLTGALFYQQDNFDSDAEDILGSLDSDMFGLRVGINAFVF